MADIEIINEIEKRLLLIEDVDKNEKEGNVSLTIKDIGTWVFKLRHQGNIYNRRDLILWEAVKIDTQFIFQDMTTFHYSMIGGMEDEISHKHIEIYGSSEISKLFRKKCSKLSLPSDENNNSSVPVRENRHISADLEQPIKAGWLLKKRDILNGWKCRYFEIYRSNSRLDYYSDQQDTQPRHSLSLLHADISDIKTFKIKKMNAYFGLIIETKNPEKSFRLASERMGLDGKAEMEGWRQALLLASGVSYPTDFHGNTSQSMPMTINPLRAALQHTSTTNPLPNPTPNPSATATTTSPSKVLPVATTTNSPNPVAHATATANANGNAAEKSLFSRKFSFKEVTGFGGGSVAAGNGESIPLTTILFYGLSLLSFALLLQYCYFVYSCISWTTYLTGNSFLIVLFAIFLQEYIFDDSSATQSLPPQNKTSSVWPRTTAAATTSVTRATGGGGEIIGDGEVSKLDGGEFDQVVIDNNHFTSANPSPAPPPAPPSTPGPNQGNVSPRLTTSPKTTRQSLLKTKKAI